MQVFKRKGSAKRLCRILGGPPGFGHGNPVRTTADPDQSLAVRERRGASPLRSGPDAEHAGMVVLAAGLVQQRPDDREGGGRARPGHPVTRHSTVTWSSRCSARKARSWPTTSSGAPPPDSTDRKSAV